MIKKFYYNIFGADVQVWIAPKWAKLYVNGMLSDHTLASDNTVLMSGTPSGNIVTAYIIMSYDGYKSNCDLHVKTAQGTTKVLPVSID